MKLKKLLIFLLALIAWNISKGQISQGGEPYSFKVDLKNKNQDTVLLSEKIPIINMQAIDKSIIEQIKQSNETENKPFQFAYSFYVDIDLKKSAVVDSLDIGLLYRLSIKSENAYSINLIFKKYLLPQGAKLFIYNNDKTDVIGAFTSNNNKSSGRLATSPVKGDEIVIEYFEPYYSNLSGEIVIGSINHDFINFSDDFGNSSFCNIDINCDVADDWQNEKRSVCKIMMNGNSLCTGALLNNTSFDGTPYFLTANHCIGNQEEADDCVFYFNYESSTCNGGDGSLEQSVSGATIVSSNSGSDFLLLELSNKPLSTYNPYYAGWNNSDIPSLSGASITHPRGDVKKIGFYNEAITASIYGGSEDWDVIWESGTVEPGSSGGPLFNNAHLVIGQVHGGYPSDICTDNDHAYFGRFDISWNSGSSANNRLRDWLDPTNSNVTTLNGANVCHEGVAKHLNITHTIEAGSVELYQATETIIASNIIRAGANVTYEAGDGINLAPGFHAEEGCTFTAQLKDFNCVPGCYPVTIDLLPNVFTPNGDGINDNLCYPVTNATHYDFKAYNRWGNLIHSSSGNVSGDYVCVWDGTGACDGCYYAVIITFSNECNEVSEAYSIMVFTGESKSTVNKSEEQDNMMLNITQEPQVFDFNMFPNPTDGKFTVKVTSTDLPYTIDIFNSTGILIYKVSETNLQEISIRKQLTSGVYYVRLNNGDNLITKKIIVN
ncbi:MAG: gliding motility-associated C-terminal domain-containing protein [Bacteroidales bacterium]|nr:gliding motility-associated C-terminal domain-containing protein [Bacteroidales bacterium]